MALRTSVSRSLLSAARSSLRSPASLPHRLSSVRVAPDSRRLLLGSTRYLGEMACMQSLLPLHSVVAATRLTAHMSVSARACCELSQGT